MATRQIGKWILRCDYEDGQTQWKVSPYAPTDYDKDAVWFDDLEEAQIMAAELTMDEERRALEAEVPNE